MSWIRILDISNEEVDDLDNWQIEIYNAVGFLKDNECFEVKVECLEELEKHCNLILGKVKEISERNEL